MLARKLSRTTCPLNAEHRSANAGLRAEASDNFVAREPGPIVFASVTNVHAEPVEGGYSASGRTPFMIGMNDAPWALVHGDVHDYGALREMDGMRGAHHFNLPASDLAVEPT